MRHGAPGRRSRNRGGGGGGGGGRSRGGHGSNNRSQVFDSNGPDVRIRGTAYQIHEKYIALARDANGLGDRILAESYLQHAEHYQRLINTWAEADAVRRPAYGEGAGTEEGQPQPEPQVTVVGKAADDLGLPPSLVAGIKKEEFQDA